MNSIDEYQAEIAYRREQMRRGQGSLRQWLRAHRPRRGTAAGNRSN
jgi:hypothetical protein